jgi:hypothetical protein
VQSFIAVSFYPIFFLTTFLGAPMVRLGHPPVLFGFIDPMNQLSKMNSILFLEKPVPKQWCE